MAQDPPSPFEGKAPLQPPLVWRQFDKKCTCILSSHLSFLESKLEYNDGLKALVHCFEPVSGHLAVFVSAEPPALCTLGAEQED